MSDRRKYDMNFLGSEAPAQGIKKASLSGHKCDFTLSMENESSAHAKAVYVQLANGFAIPSIYWILHRYYGLDLESNPGHTIHSSLVIVLPTIILGYSLLRLHPKSCPIWRAIGRGLLSIPLGALVAAFIGTALGAPIGIKYVMQTSYWALLVSTLMVAPAATVLGNSFYDWQRIFAFTRPNGAVELSICVPAHGAAIGAWIGAWPMPLDWDRPWQVSRELHRLQLVQPLPDLKSHTLEREVRRKGKQPQEPYRHHAFHRIEYPLRLLHPERIICLFIWEEQYSFRFLLKLYTFYLGILPAN